MIRPWQPKRDARRSRAGARANQSEKLLLGGLTLAAFLLHLVFYRGYGFFRDELYFIACGRHLAFGYVDQPPGVALVARFSQAVLGRTLFAIRFVPMLFAAAQVLLAGLTARALGGSRHAVLLAGVCVMAAPQYFGSYLNTDIFVVLGWAVCAYIAVLILAGGGPRLWLWFGLAAGLALEGKHAMLFFGFAFLVSLLLSPQRKLLASRWPYLGGAVAFAVFLPNLVWEWRHHWATIELLQNIAHSHKNLVLTPWQYLDTNIHSLSTLSFPIWAGGVLWCLFSKDGRRFRPIGWSWIVAYVTFIVLKGKAYYLAPIYTPLFAAGAVAIGLWLERHRSRRVWITPAVQTALVLVVLLYGMLGWPFAMPVMSVPRFIAYEQALGVVPQKTETMSLGALPQQYADMFGWRRMAAEVAQVYDTLPASERGATGNACGIYGQNYGEAGAIDYFGGAYGLPQAISGHQSYWLWGPRGYTGACLVVIGDTRAGLGHWYNNITQAGETDAPNAIPYENHLPIWIAHGPKFGNLQQVWPQLKHWM